MPFQAKTSQRDFFRNSAPYEKCLPCPPLRDVLLVSFLKAIGCLAGKWTRALPDGVEARVQFQDAAEVRSERIKEAGVGGDADVSALNEDAVRL